MIKIKNNIFNENKIIEICINERNNLEIDVDNGFPRLIKDANFSDIEWNYEDEQIRKYLESIDREKELETQIKNQKEELRKQSEVIIPKNIEQHNEIDDYKSRINKAIEYIEELYTRYIADYSDIERLEKILKGEENESN